MELQSFLCGLDPDTLRNWPRNVLPRPPRLGLHPARASARAVSTVRQRVGQLADTPRQVLNHVNRERIRRHLPIPTGEYTVGCVDLMSGHTVNGTFIRLYYPTTPTDIYLREAQWPLWLPRKQYGHGYVYFRRRNPIFGRILNWFGGDVYVPVLWQAPVIESDQQFPVLVFSHGLGGNRTTNTTICYDLASHGYIVAAIEHRDGSASMTYCFKEPVNNNNAGEEEAVTEEEEDDEDFINCQFDILHENHSFQHHWLQYQRQEDELNYELRNKQIHMRAKELSKVLDMLEAMNSGKEVRNVLGLNFDMRQFKNTMDLDRVAVAGHSFGGGTAVATIAEDKRFKCAIGLDSWMIPLDDGVYNNANQPVMMLNMETFQWPANVRAMLKLNLNQEDSLSRILLTIMGTCHQTVSDFQFVMPGRLARLAELRHTLEPYLAMDLVKRAMRGFLSKHLNIPFCDHHDNMLSGEHGLVIRGTNLDLRQNWEPRPP